MAQIHLQLSAMNHLIGKKKRKAVPDLEVLWIQKTKLTTITEKRNHHADLKHKYEINKANAP